MDEDLRAKFMRRKELDQEVRLRVPVGTTLTPEHAAEWERIDTDNTAFLKAVIAEYGWPGSDLIGHDGAIAAWLFCQHADRDPAFQAECLPLLEAAARAGQARLCDWAYLEDRVRVAAGLPQRFGSQYGQDGPRDIEDPEHLDELRAQVGLEPHADYDRRIRCT
jgi:uncharacterized protein DUF6624